MIEINDFYYAIMLKEAKAAEHFVGEFKMLMATKLLAKLLAPANNKRSNSRAISIFIRLQ